MATITLDQIKDLRKRTGAGVANIKEALESSKGDIEQAILYLRQKGLAKANKRAANQTDYGYIASYIHSGGSIGTLVEINTETDFAAKNDRIKSLAYEIALHVAASDPQFVRIDEVPAEVLEKEKVVFAADLKGKPKDVAEKIIQGKLQKYYEEIVLEEQPYLKDPTKKVKDVINDTISAVGEKVVIGRVARIKIASSATACGGFTE